MNIGGIHLESKKENFPQIKAKPNSQQIKNNNGSLIFDSHFECGNLLYVFKNDD